MSAIWVGVIGFSIFTGCSAMIVYEMAKENKRPKVEYWGYAIIGVVFFFSCMALLNVTLVPYVEKQNHEERLVSQDKKKKKELLNQTEVWFDSYDNKKFSSYELYLLDNLEMVTQVKVHKQALTLRNESKKENKDKFSKLLIDAKEVLSRNEVSYEE